MGALVRGGAARARPGAILAAAWALCATASDCGSAPLPGALAPFGPPTTTAAAIERQEVCVGSTVHSAGELADALFYEELGTTPDGGLVVGYYAFFSEERPWGNNWLTWSVLPALVIDLIYTRTLFVAPGVQRLAFGKADVEGFRVAYEVDQSGELRASYAVADDGVHSERRIERPDLDTLYPGRVVVYTDAWNHHLAGAGARIPSDLVYTRCFGPGSITPLTDELRAEYRLERRAHPARMR